MSNLYRYTNLKEKLHVASALDPHFKTLPFLSDEDREDVFKILISEMVTLEQVKIQDVSFETENVNTTTYLFTV